jgi:3',5'-cyclic AMP phosphodiesterase CpdA
MAMLIAQMTDTHIGFTGSEGSAELNEQRFLAVLARLLEGANRPDMLVLSGDITDRGDAESFARVAEMVVGCAFPVWPIVGNHDSRAGLLGAFPQVSADEDGFAHYVLEHNGLRIVFLDTLEEGRHGGAFCERRQAWLEARLDEAPATPTLIFMHHPPIVSGIEWMDPGPNEPWVRRFAAAVRGREQVRAIHCGHLHRPIVTSFAGIPLGVAPSVAPLLALDLRPIDPDRPDGREVIVAEPPGYALHRWDGTSLVTHYEQVSDWQVLARYTEKLRRMMQEMMGERS